MTTESANGSRGPFIDRVVSSSMEETASFPAGKTTSEITQKEAGSTRPAQTIRSGLAEVNGSSISAGAVSLNFGYGSPNGPSTAATPSAPAPSVSTLPSSKEDDGMELISKLLTSELLTSLSSKEKNALITLLQDNNLTLAAGVALLSQIRNYPTETVIKNLTLLAGNDWFRDYELADQQRSAWFIAFASRYTVVDRTKNAKARKILDNTLAFILGPHGYRVKWADLDHHGETYNDLIVFNENIVPRGNHQVISDDAIHIAIKTSSHETSHILFKADLAKRGKSFTLGGLLNLRSECIAYFVGDTAFGLNISQRRAYEIIRENFIIDNEFYQPILATFKNPKSRKDKKESEKMAQFIVKVCGIKMPGMDPEKATPADVLKFDEAFQKNPALLSDTEPASIPDDEDGHPANLDNHLEP